MIVTSFPSMGVNSVEVNKTDKIRPMFTSKYNGKKIEKLLNGYQMSSQVTETFLHECVNDDIKCSKLTCINQNTPRGL